MAEQRESVIEEQKLSPEAREVIKIFQEAIKTTDLDAQKKLVREFYTKLLLIIDPKGGHHPNWNDKDLVEVILYGRDSCAGGLWVGTGSSGERIIFINYLLSEDFNDKETEDKMSGWMIYAKPEQGSGNWAFEFWQNFTKHFGGEIVDLRQAFKTS